MNSCREAARSARWGGDLGKIVFDAWCGANVNEPLTYIPRRACWKADFISDSGASVGVKTVKRKGAPLPSYTAQISAKHAVEPVDQFFFMSYEIAARKMWLLGGIDRAGFLKEARYYQAGEAVHASYVIRPGHEIYNIGIKFLFDPRSWLKSVA
ncbi:hypothetical protein [Stenotrophomonas sp. Ker107b]